MVCAVIVCVLWCLQHWDRQQLDVPASQPLAIGMERLTHRSLPAPSGGGGEHERVPGRVVCFPSSNLNAFLIVIELSQDDKLPCIYILISYLLLNSRHRNQKQPPPSSFILFVCLLLSLFSTHRQIQWKRSTIVSLHRLFRPLSFESSSFGTHTPPPPGSFFNLLEFYDSIKVSFPTWRQ